MKSLFLVCFLALAATALAQGNTTTFGTNCPVTQTPQTFNFPLGSACTIKSEGDTGGSLNLKIDLLAKVGIAKGFTESRLPDGYESFTVGIGVDLQVGYTMTLDKSCPSDVAITWVSPKITGVAEALAKGRIVAMGYDVDAQAYAVLESSISADGVITIPFKIPAGQTKKQFFLCKSVFAGTTVVVGSGQQCVCGGGKQNFTYTKDNKNLLTIGNYDADAGTLKVDISAKLQAQIDAAKQNGRTLLNGYAYTLTSSGGLKQATLSCDTAGSSNNNLKWYKWDDSNSVWNQMGGEVQGSALVYTTTGFSDWSVQEGFAFAKNAPSVFVVLAMMILAYIAKY